MLQAVWYPVKVVEQSSLRCGGSCLVSAAEAEGCELHFEILFGMFSWVFITPRIQVLSSSMSETQDSLCQFTCKLRCRWARRKEQKGKKTEWDWGYASICWIRDKFSLKCHHQIWDRWLWPNISGVCPRSGQYALQMPDFCSDLRSGPSRTPRRSLPVHPPSRQILLIASMPYWLPDGVELPL